MKIKSLLQEGVDAIADAFEEKISRDPQVIDSENQLKEQFKSVYDSMGYDTADSISDAIGAALTANINIAFRLGVAEGVRLAMELRELSAPLGGAADV